MPIRILLRTIVLLLIGAWPLVHAESVPYLSYQDLRSIYPKTKPVFDWTWPTSTISDEAALIKKCDKDFDNYFGEARLREKYPLANGKITLRRIIKDPSSAIVYLAFKVEPEELPDLMVIYFYDPGAKALVLKTMLSL